MRAAEENLDVFGTRSDQTLKVQPQWKLNYMSKCNKCCDCGAHTAVRKLLSQPRYLQRTGPWIAPRSTAESGALQGRSDQATRRPLSELYFDLEHRTERTVNRTHRHSQACGYLHKPKTRALPS